MTHGNRTWLALTFGFLMAATGMAANTPFGDEAVASRQTEAAMESLARQLAPNVASLPPGPTAAFQQWTLDQVFDGLNRNETPAPTRVKFVWANDDAWYCRWQMLAAAKNTIDCTYYILDKDIFGQSFLGLLARKARQGVKVRLMIDGRIYRTPYMKGMPDRIQELAGFPNVEIKLYNSVSQSLLHAFTDFKGLFASNHDKIIIIDGVLSITGGRNIGPDYFAQNGEYPIVYRDTDILMHGRQVASRMKQAFEEEWKCLRNSVVKPDVINFRDQRDRLHIAAMVMERYLYGLKPVDPAKTNWTKAQKAILAELNAEVAKFKNLSSLANYRMFTNERTMPVKIVDKHSALGKVNDIGPCLQAFCEAARSEIVIQNPYVVLSDQAWEALRRASARGVKIIFHTNSGASTDSLFPQAFLMNDWVRMLTEMPTCRLFVAPSQNERLHSKTFVVDRQIVIIGSYNMDPLSETSNSEAVAVVNDRAFAAEVRDQIDRDMRVVLEYRIKIGPDGKTVSAFGPEHHLDPKILKKMNLYRKLKWIRPVI